MLRRMVWDYLLRDAAFSTRNVWRWVRAIFRKAEIGLVVSTSVSSMVLGFFTATKVMEVTSKGIPGSVLVLDQPERVGTFAHTSGELYRTEAQASRKSPCVSR